MNTFNSIIEPIEDISTIYNEDHNCTAIINETTKEVCGETESLKIIDEFQKLYETRIQNVDQELVNEFDQVRMKLEISNEWIRNLREQNIMLVQVVEGLEQTACNRVKLLEEKLKESSMLVSESMTNSNYTHKNIHTLSNRINDLEKDEEYMKQKIEFLQSDIRGLLELIRRAVQQNHWNLDGIQFFEIQPSNIPIPTNCTCDQDEVDPKKIQSLKLQIEHLQKKEKKMIAYQSELENKLADLNAKLKSKEDEIKKYNSQFQNFTDHLKKRTNLTDQIGCSSFVTRDQQTFDEACTTQKTCVNINASQKETEMLNSPLKQQQFVDINGQFTLMDIFRICAIEAQVTIENIKDEMNVIVSTFKSRHQKYVDLNKQVLDLHNQLIKDREKISETINKLQLQEEERARHTERISSGKMKLKDIKNELNHAQSRFFVHINEIQNENVISGYTEMCTCNDLLYSAVDEVEEASKSLQVFQIQECNIATELQGLRNQFYKIDSSIKKLQQTTDEALLEHNTVETTLSQKEQKLEKLENEVDMIHLKIKNILETYNSADDQKFDGDITKSQLYTQTLNEILQTKQDLYKLRKKHDELKYKMSQNAPYQECNEKTCLWKSKVTDLEDQIKIMQHEATCNIEANNFLKNSIESMEEELRVAQVKAENYRRSHSIDSMELKKQIIELENTLKSQKEIECGLRQRLSDTEIELKKSKELLHCPHADYSTEEMLHCGCSQFKHDIMTVPELFKTLLCTMKSIKCGLQELKAELKKLICKDSSDFNSSAKSLICLMEKLQKYEDELDDCFQEIDKLKNTLYSKEKLLENKDKIIQIQKDTIMMTQAELKELHQRLQAKIDNQDQIISQYEKEKKELIKQNELQVQTIGHLQNAVVEAKKCIDQMGHKTMNEVSEPWPKLPTSIYNQRNVHDV